MSMRLVYVDAENLSLTTIQKEIEQIKLHGPITGKVYGSKESIGKCITFCLLEGFEFVETSVLSPTKKNLADSKLIVDCMYDVFKIGPANIEKVYILSNDNDFLPLIYTLLKMNVSVVSSLIDSVILKDCVSNTIPSTKTLNSYLKEIGFYSNKNNNLFGNMYQSIIDVTSDRFSYDIIEEHIVLKCQKFIKNMELEFGSEVGELLREIDPKDWSLDEVLNIISSVCVLDNSNRFYVEDTYIRLIYGFIRKKSKIGNTSSM